MADDFSLGRWIRRRRKAIDLTQAVLADRIGCSVQTIKKIESGERRPSRQMAERLAAFLEIAQADRSLFCKVATGEVAAFRFEVAGGFTAQSFVPAEPVHGGLRRLAIMSGSWTLAAAHALAEIRDVSVFEQQGHILRVPGDDSEPRFTFPETVRQHLLAVLYAAGEEAAAHSAHAHYYLALVECTRPPSDALARQRWLQMMAQEAANLELALAWSLTHQPTWALRLSAALGPLWTRRGTPHTGVVQLAAALDQTGLAHDRDRAAAFAWLGLLYFHRSDLNAACESYATSLAAYHALNDQEGIAWVLRELARAQVDPALARAHLHASEQLCRTLGDDIGAGAALNELGNLERWQGNYGDAQALHEQSLARFRAAGDLPGSVEALYSLGLALAAQGKAADARAVYTEGVALSRAIGDRLHVAWCTMNLGMVESDMGLFNAAEPRLSDAEALFQQLGDQSGSAWCAFNQGQLAVRCGQPQRAAGLFTDAHALFRTIGDPWGQAWTLAHLGDSLCRLGDIPNARQALHHSAHLVRQQQSSGGIPRLVESCARLVLAEHGALPAATHLFAAAATLMQRANEQRRRADQAIYDHTIDTLRSALGETSFAAAWAAGVRLSADEALDAVLGLTNGQPIEDATVWLVPSCTALSQEI